MRITQMTDDQLERARDDAEARGNWARVYSGTMETGGSRQYGERVSGHHYINESRPDQQFMINVHWDTMTVHIRELVPVSDEARAVGTNPWRTVSITPLNADSPGR